ncbi:MAG: hypothetical protein ACREC9_10000 [Methylocella sp.]
MTILSRKGLAAAALLGLVVGANEAFAEWSAAVFANQKGANFHATAVNSETIFYGTCNTNSEPGLHVSIGPYRGKALDRIEDVSRSVIFIIKTHDGANREFRSTMYYYGGDKEWVIDMSNRLPPAFMNEFGRGGLLTIRNGRGEKVVDFDLGGAGKARETVRRVCHM